MTTDIILYFLYEKKRRIASTNWLTLMTLSPNKYKFYKQVDIHNSIYGDTQYVYHLF